MRLGGSKAWGLAYREVLFEMQRGRCALCGFPMRREYSNHPRSATIDHVFPRSAGGKNTKDNRVLAHQRCNVEKGDRAPTGCELVWLELAKACPPVFVEIIHTCGPKDATIAGDSCYGKTAPRDACNAPREPDQSAIGVPHGS